MTPTTPTDFVAEWLPEYQKKVAEFFIRYSFEICPTNATWRAFIEKHFAEALEARERHIWEEACKAQREECLQITVKACNSSLYGEPYTVFRTLAVEGIINAPMPEYKQIKTE